MTAMLLSAFVHLASLASLSGELPLQVEPDAVGRIAWVSGDMASAIQRSECQLRRPRGWTCEAQSPGDVGAVVIEMADLSAFVVIGREGVIASGTAPWTRMIRAVVSIGPTGEIAEVSATALRVWHPAARPNTRVLDVEPDGAVQVWAVAPNAFWIAGTSRSPGSFIRLAAQNAAHDEPLERVWGDVADAPLDVALHQSLSVHGRVEAESQAVSGALVDLLVRPPEDGDTRMPQVLKTARVIRIASTRTDQDGTFTFDGLEPRLYKVAVVDFEHGRGEQWVDGNGPAVLITLEAPSKATGRVLRGKLPAPHVVVRFTPDADAWRESTDPSAHLTLDAVSDEGGSFVVRLPPAAEGTLQLTAADGATKRIPLRGSPKASDVTLGDIRLEEPIAVEVQTDVTGCIVSAVGPAGAGGFSIVRAKSNGIAHTLLLPEPGQWLMQVECAGVQRTVAPPSIDVSAKGELPIRHLHVE
jgi:hypothetical protein